MPIECAVSLYMYLNRTRTDVHFCISVFGLEQEQGDDIVYTPLEMCGFRILNWLTGNHGFNPCIWSKNHSKMRTLFLQLLPYLYS